jgi:bifunctional non-homologous end joining protein LigD
LFLDGADLTGLPLTARKKRLATLLNRVSAPLEYSDHHVGNGRAFHAEACKLGLEGIVAKPPMPHTRPAIAGSG